MAGSGRRRVNGRTVAWLYDKQAIGKVVEGGDPVEIDDLYRICVGYLRREPSSALHITFRDLDIMIKAEHDRGDNMWDYTRNIMAAMGAGQPKEIIQLDRDKPDIDDEMIEEAKKFLNRIRGN